MSSITMRSITLAGFALSLILGATAMAQDMLKAETQNGIEFLTGGVSDEEQSAIRGMGGNYNLEILLALKEGNYLAKVPVTIADESGATVLAVTTNGPFLLANLPAGQYTVTATRPTTEETQQKTAYIRDGEQEHLNFYW